MTESGGTNVVIDAPPAQMKRLIGSLGDPARGATLLCFGGIHGNEPSGAVALERVIAKLQDVAEGLTGAFVALRGNVPALKAGERYIDEDLNRIWTEERFAQLEAERAPSCEDREMLELRATIDQAVARAKHAVYALDLHTSSAETAPFVLTGDTLRNRHFAQRLGVPLILGLEERITGTITEFVNERGVITLGFEAGQHADPRSIDRHEAAVWMGLRAAEVLPPGLLDDEVRRSEELLREATLGLPRVLEIRHRHGLEDSPDFQMTPGFRNFDPIESGETLARNARGDIHAPEAGIVLLPLYQKLGVDGFFIARPVRPIWLKISTLLRGMGIASLMHWLPGVRRLRDEPGTVLVDPAVARIFPVEIFHLLGFRRRTSDSGKLVFSRRRFDINAPER